MGQFVSSQKCNSRKRYNSPKPVSPYRRVIPRVPLIIRDLEARLKLNKKENTPDNMFEYLKKFSESKEAAKSGIYDKSCENEKETNCTISESQTEVFNSNQLQYAKSVRSERVTPYLGIKSLIHKKTKPMSEQLSPKVIQSPRIRKVKSPSYTRDKLEYQFSFQERYCSPKLSDLIKHEKLGAERPHRRITSTNRKQSISGYIEPKLKPSSTSSKKFLRLKHVMRSSKCLNINKLQ